MQRLSGFDASFLYSETPTVLMHTLKVAVIDPPPGGPNVDFFQRLREELGRILHRLPGFRLRLVEVPLGLDHPVWIEDPYLDLDYHLHRIALPGPGGPREIDSVIADIAGHPLDRNHPLWEIWMVEGLASGGLAFVAKIHHAVADGGASAAMLANVMSTEAFGAGQSGPERAAKAGSSEAGGPKEGQGTQSRGAGERHGEEIPTPWKLVRDALGDQVRKSGGVIPLAARTVRGSVAVLKRYREASTHPPRPFDTPRTPFDRPLTPTRSFATTELDLARVKAVKDALDVTLNDVVLALAGGALLGYLEGRGEHPDRSLIAAVPVSIGEKKGAPRLSGNRLSNVFMSLGTDIADPIARVRRIHEVSEAAKETHEKLGPGVLVEWAEYAPPRAYSLAYRAYTDLRIARLHRPAANVIVSNVRGPSSPLFGPGIRLRHMYSVGPILDGIGLNITAWSYAGELAVGVLAGREAVPDAHRIMDGFHSALAELERAIRPAAKAPAQPKKRRARRARASER